MERKQDRGRKRGATMHRRTAKAGETMVELLVAFVVVMLMTTLFARTVSTATRVLQMAERTESRQAAFEDKYHKTDSKKTAVKVQTEIITMTQTGVGHIIHLPTVCLKKFQSGGIRYFFEAKPKTETETESP